MKKLILLTALFLCAFAFAARAEQAKVKLKNGVELTGTVVSIDPMQGVVLEIAGKQTSISMADVAAIENVGSASASAAPASAAPATAEAELPKEKTVNIAGHDVKFVLVPAYTFSYGYDGDGSRFNDSEPVHEVELSAFYVSEEPVSVDLAKDVMGCNPWGEYEYSLDEKNLERAVRNKLDLPVPEDRATIKDLALFYPTFNKYEIQNLQMGKIAKEGESFPSAKAFIDDVQKKAGKDVKLLNEVQYASIVKQDIDAVKFPIAPDVMMSVNMNERKNPSVDKYILKGLGTYVSPGGFRNPVLINKVDLRVSMGLHNVDKKKKTVGIYAFGHAVGPIHLVIPAE
ncbi:MAG: hypothetical protein NC418_06635 [Muribaculaceae bacterium]|nr:hypothetical protein [Muribaculaceae bacterium]